MILASTILLSSCASADLQNKDEIIELQQHTKPVDVNVIAGGFGHSLAIKADNSLWAWGNNSSNEIGNGEGGKYGEKSLTHVKIMENVVFVAAGDYHSYAIKADGSLWGWGNNINKLIDGGEKYEAKKRTPVRIMDDVSYIASGFSHTLAIKADGSLWAWGNNACGKIGDGTVTTYKRNGNEGVLSIDKDNDKSTPVKIMSEVIDVAVGSDFSLALKKDGSLWAWGSNNAGQLGDGTITTYYDKFEEKIKKNNDKSKPIKIMDNVASIAAGGAYSLAVKTDGTLWAWGDNSYGALGDGTITTYESRVIIDDNNKSGPVKIMDNVSSVVAGSSYNLAIKTDGSLWGWGANYYGQLGDNTTETRGVPQKIMDDVVSIAAGAAHSLAVKTDGSLWAWGWNSWGQLGDGNVIQKYFPIKIMDGVKLQVLTGDENIIDDSQAKIIPESYFIKASDDNRIFVREEADITSNILLRIEIGDKGIRLKDMGEKKLVEAYEWYKVQLPDGRIGWVREDVIVAEGESKAFQVETDIRYYYLEEDYPFVFNDDYYVTGVFELQIRVPIVSKETQDAAAVNAKINEDITQYIRPLYDQFVKDDFSSIKKQGADQISNISINYEVYQYKDLFALVVDGWYGLAEAGGSYMCKVYYYDGKDKKMVDAKTYATLAGYTKEDIILAENNNPEAYYQAEAFEQVKFYIKNDGTLCATVEFSD